MWHLALVGERHLVTGHTLDERRREHRVHQYVTALELWRDARLDSGGTRRGMRKVRTAHSRQRAARDAALKLLTVEDFERRMQVWVERLEAAERHGNRLDLIGASSVERGVVRGAATADPRTTSALLAASSSAVAPAAIDASPSRTPGTSEASEPFADEFQAALTGATPAVSADDTNLDPDDDQADEPAEAVVADDGTDDGEDAGPADVLEPAATVDEVAPALDEERLSVDATAGLPGTREPLPETGHTRRVEVFGLLGESDPALGGALAHRSAFLTAHGASASAGAQPDAGLRAGSDAVAADDAGSAEDADDVPASDRDRRIVELAGDGLSQREIAERVEVSRATVGRVMKRYATV